MKAKYKLKSVKENPDDTLEMRIVDADGVEYIVSNVRATAEPKGDRLLIEGTYEDFKPA